MSSGLAMTESTIPSKMSPTGAHTYRPRLLQACRRTRACVNSHAVAATWTDAPTNSSQARPTSGAAPGPGARTTEVVSAPQVRPIDAHIHRAAGFLHVV